MFVLDVKVFNTMHRRRQFVNQQSVKLTADFHIFQICEDWVFGLNSNWQHLSHGLFVQITVPVRGGQRIIRMDLHDKNSADGRVECAIVTAPSARPHGLSYSPPYTQRNATNPR